MRDRAGRIENAALLRAAATAESGDSTPHRAYDEQVLSDAKLPTVDGRPTSSVVRTISE
jgi:hypothetical protein